MALDLRSSMHWSMQSKRPVAMLRRPLTAYYIIVIFTTDQPCSETVTRRSIVFLSRSRDI